MRTPTIPTAMINVHYSIFEADFPTIAPEAVKLYLVLAKEANEYPWTWRFTTSVNYLSTPSGVRPDGVIAALGILRGRHLVDFKMSIKRPHDGRFLIELTEWGAETGDRSETVETATLAPPYTLS